MHNGHSQWGDWLSPLNVFQYSTFRSAGAAVTALLLCWWLGPRVIRWLQYLANQEYEDMAREGGGMSDGVSKKNVPTIGGKLLLELAFHRLSDVFGPGHGGGLDKSGSGACEDEGFGIPERATLKLWVVCLNPDRRSGARISW